MSVLCESFFVDKQGIQKSRFILNNLLYDTSLPIYQPSMQMYQMCFYCDVYVFNNAKKVILILSLATTCCDTGLAGHGYLSESDIPLDISTNARFGENPCAILLL